MGIVKRGKRHIPCFLVGGEDTWFLKLLLQLGKLYELFIDLFFLVRPFAVEDFHIEKVDHILKRLPAEVEFVLLLWRKARFESVKDFLELLSHD